jgi:hypothetical protein
VSRTSDHLHAFHQSTFVYFDLDGLKYWTLGSLLPETTVLNRDPIDNRYRRQFDWGRM